MDLSFLNFIDYVLSPDPVQKRTLMMGFMYHSYLLDVLSGKTMSQQGLREVVLAFGLIGFTVLALNRAWWKPSILISWLVVTMIVMLGGRGEVLTLSVDGNIVTPTPTQALLQSKSMQSSVQLIDDVRSAMLRLGILSGSRDDPITLEGGQVIRFARSADGLDQISVYDPSAPVKAYTPAVLTLYAMNRLKTVLLMSLPYPNSGDMVAMRAAANRMLAGQPDFPATKYLTDIFGSSCVLKNPVIRDVINGRNGFFYPKSDWDKPQLKDFMDALKNTKLQVRDIENVNNTIFPALSTFDQQANYPVVGVVSASVRDQLPQYLRTTRYVGNEQIISGNVNSDRITTPSDFAENAARNAKSTLNAEGVYVVEGLPKNILDMPASMYVKRPKAATEGSSSVEYEDPAVLSSCYDIFLVVNMAYTREVELSNLDKTAGRLARKALQSGTNVNRIDGTASEAELARLTLQQAAHERDEKCKSIRPNQQSITNECEDAQKQYATLEIAFKQNAVHVRLGLLAETQNAVYQPGQLFKSPVRDAMSKLGDLLSPVALWFMALFGGFTTGTYAGIIPTFMSFVMAMIIAITPLLFMVGLLIPSFCPGILMTPVLALLYLKTVEIMFVVVTSVFSMLKEGVISAESFSNDGKIASGQALVTSIYDIVVGLVYTSMFMVAGYIFNMGSPDKLLGKLGGLDGIGKIDMKEALQFGGATAIASRAIGMAAGGAGGAIRASERMALGKSPFGGGITDFINRNRQQARSEVAGQIGREEAMRQTGDEFLSQTGGAAIEKGNESRITGQAYQQRMADGTLAPMGKDQVIDQAKIKQVDIESAEFKKTKSDDRTLRDYGSMSAAERQAQYLKEHQGQQLKDEMRDTIDGALGDQADALQYAGNYDEAFKAFNAEFKARAKRMGFSNEADDAKYRDGEGQWWEGSGAVDVLKGFVRDKMKANGKLDGLAKHKAEALVMAETQKILQQNEGNVKGLFSHMESGKDEMDGLVKSNIYLNTGAAGLKEFMGSNSQLGGKEDFSSKYGMRYWSEMKIKGSGRTAGKVTTAEEARQEQAQATAKATVDAARGAGAAQQGGGFGGLGGGGLGGSSSNSMSAGPVGRRGGSRRGNDDIIDGEFTVVNERRKIGYDGDNRRLGRDKNKKK